MCRPPKDATTSSRVVPNTFSLNFESAKRLISHGISTFTVLAYVLVPGETFVQHIKRMSLKSFRIRACERCFVSTFSSHSKARADRFMKHHPLRKACTAWVRALTKFEILSCTSKRALEIVIIVAYNFSPCVPHQKKKRYAPLAALLMCEFFKIRASLTF